MTRTTETRTFEYDGQGRVTREIVVVETEDVASAEPTTATTGYVYTYPPTITTGISYSCNCVCSGNGPCPRLGGSH